MPPHSNNYDPKLPEDHHNLGDRKPIRDLIVYTLATVTILGGIFLGGRSIMDYFFSKLTLDEEIHYLSNASEFAYSKIKENEILSAIKNDIVTQMPNSEVLSKIKIFYQCDNTVNAFTYPGGTIVVSSNLIKQVKTLEGLSFVIGHEIGHVYNRHIIKNFSSNVTAFFIKSLLGSSLTGLQEGIVNHSSLKFSRVHEEEADLFGVEAMKKLYNSLNGGDEFFKVILNIKDKSPMFSTHPATDERLDKLFSSVENDFVGTDHGIEVNCP